LGGILRHRHATEGRQSRSPQEVEVVDKKVRRACAEGDGEKVPVRDQKREKHVGRH